MNCFRVYWKFLPDHSHSKGLLSMTPIVNVASFSRFVILIQNIIQTFCIFYLSILFMIGLLLLWETLSINIVQEACCTPSKKIVVLHPYIVPPHNGPPSTTASFFCPWGGRCGEVRLYFKNSLIDFFSNLAKVKTTI